MKRQNPAKSATSTTTNTAASAPRSASTSTRRKTAGFPALEIKHRPTPPTTEEIRRRAYEIYQRRMRTGEPGSPENDWERAERELSGR